MEQGRDHGMDDFHAETPMGVMGKCRFEWDAIPCVDARVVGLAIINSRVCDVVLVQGVYEGIDGSARGGTGRGHGERQSKE